VSESKEQAKVLKWLKANGFWVFKTIECNRAGIMDIIACAPDGKFVGIEMKYGSNKASKLQAWNITEVIKCNGIAFVAWSLEEVKQRLKDYEI
jgi:Holliday junction resolvase-like predicted endonuclease